MIGYLRPYLPELKIQDYRIYRSYCCGLCSQLRMDYGITTRQLLNHDTILLALLADSLAGREPTTMHHVCPKHWLKKQAMLCHTKGIRYSSQVEIILAWHKANRIDASELKFADKINFLWEKLVLKSAYMRAIADGRHIERLLLQALDHAEALELANCTDYDTACEPFGNFYGALFAACASDESSVKPLRKLGFSVGKIYCLLESAERFESDKTRGRYNVFVANGLSKESAVENAKNRCNMAAAELARSYNLLTIKMNRSLLDNIMFYGLQNTVANVGKPQEQKWEYDAVP